MPASREFNIIINEIILEEIARDTGITRPVNIKISRQPQSRLHGTWHPAKRLVILELGMQRFEHSRLSLVHTEIVQTLLHEIRHAQQDDTWTPEKLAADLLLPYHAQECERDANQWAQANAVKYRALLKIRPRTSSKLGRLAKAELTARAQ